MRASIGAWWRSKNTAGWKSSSVVDVHCVGKAIAPHISIHKSVLIFLGVGLSGVRCWGWRGSKKVTAGWKSSGVIDVHCVGRLLRLAPPNFFGGLLSGVLLVP